MGENKRKHLEFIQNTIKRLADHSASVKGWVVALVAAIFALAAKSDSHKVVYAAYSVVPFAWLLDAYFLSKERMFRKLYDKVRQLAERDIDFSMEPSQCPCEDEVDAWVRAARSKPLLIYYGLLLLLTYATGKFLS